MYHSTGVLAPIEKFQKGGLLWKTIGRPAYSYGLKYSPQIFVAGGLARGFYNSNRYRMPYNPNQTLTTYTTSGHKPRTTLPINRRKKIYPNSIPKKMPGKKKTYRRKPRRVYRRKKTSIARQVVPSSRLVKMRLCERILLTGTTGAIANKSILYNSLQDPLLTDSTNQPYYYDQVKTMYRSATVLGAKVTVQFHNTSSTVPAVVGLYQLPWDNSQTLSSYEFWREISAKGRQRIISSDVDIVTMVIKNSTKRHLGVSNVKDNQDVVCDIENDGDPTRLLYNVFFCQAVDQASTSTVEAVITLEQVVLLQHPYSPARSVDA